MKIFCKFYYFIVYVKNSVIKNENLFDFKGNLSNPISKMHLNFF